MSTLRISNIEAKSVPASATIDEKVKITNSSGDVLVFIDGKTSGITTVGINTTDSNITFDANSNVVVTGIITASKFVGTFEPTNLTLTGDLLVPDKIVHTGDTNTAIRFPAADTISFETSGGEKLRIEGGGDVSIGGMDANTFNGYRTFTIGGSGASDGAGIDLERSDGNIYGRFFADANGVQIQSPQSGDYIRFETAGANERLRITDDGTFGVNLTTPKTTKGIHISKGTGNGGIGNSYSLGNEYLHFGYSEHNGSGDMGLFTMGFGYVAGGTPATNSPAYFGYRETSISGYTNGALVFATRNVTTNTAPTERLRITSDGKMGLGITSPTGKFAVSDGTRIAEINPHSSGTFIGNRSNHDVLFQINAATKAKIDTNGHLTVTDGNLVIGTSGHGIDFSASGNAGGMTNELLDDYEEGSFTLTPTASNGNAIALNSNYNTGVYTRVGNLVHIQAYLSFSSNSNADGYLELNSLPFTVDSNQAQASGHVRVIQQVYLNRNYAYLPDGAGYYNAQLYCNEGSTWIRLYDLNDKGRRIETIAKFLGGGADVFLNFSYLAA